MQANYLIDTSLAKNLIDFFANQWIENYSGYNRYTPEQAAKNIKATVEMWLEKGFETSWSLGGTSNNCWGDSSLVSPEIEPELPMLDEFFMEHYPTIGFMQYKIVTKAIVRDTYSDNDYYGGSTNNGKKSLSFADLSEALIKAKIITTPEVVRVSTLDCYIDQQFGVEKLSTVFQPHKKEKSVKAQKTKK